MKLAKKVFAVVMALGLIACMSAMAFAANTGFSVDSYTEGKTLYVSVKTVNGYGLTSGTIDVHFAGGAAYDHAITSNDAKAINDSDDNAFYSDVNNTGAGRVIYGFYFKEMLPADDFEVVTFAFKLDGTAYEINVDITSKDYDGDNAPYAQSITGATTVAPAPAEPVDTIPAPVDPNPAPVPGNPAPCDSAPEKVPAKPIKTDGGKNTGDNGVIAVVAGVVALAGVAFVVTKKRK